MTKRFHFHLGGAAGEGIMITGSVFSKLAMRSGHGVFDYVEFPSLIRGGHNLFYATIGEGEVRSTYELADLLVVLNQVTVEEHKGKLNKGAGVLFDPNEVKIDSLGKEIKGLPIPLGKMAEELGASLLRNTIALGAVVELWGGDLEILQEILAETFADKGEEVTGQNKLAAEKGFIYAKEKWGVLVEALVLQAEKEKRFLIGGNEALAVGAAAAEMKLAVIYPMTPISGMLTFLAKKEKEADFGYFQPEDEIAGISAALGGAFAGLRSMVATSGGGFALMNESLSLAGLTELPVVVVMGQRAGPATGIPTWTAQEDLLYCLTAAQGEYPRVLLAPGDQEECFEWVGKAFDLADLLQTPVVVLVDKFVCESHRAVVMFGERKALGKGKWANEEEKKAFEGKIFPRYSLSEDGISKRVAPGKGLIVKANSDEHDQWGLSCEEKENREEQVQKRMRKLTQIPKEFLRPKVYGPDEAELTLVGWGSVKGPVLEALELVKEDGLKVNFLHLVFLQPFPGEEVAEILGKAKRSLLLENNYEGQLGKWIRMQTGIKLEEKFLKYNGRQFYPEEIVRKVKSIMGGENGNF